MHNNAKALSFVHVLSIFPAILQLFFVLFPITNLFFRSLHTGMERRAVYNAGKFQWFLLNLKAIFFL